VVSFLLLRRGAAESLNIRGAALEVRSDLLGSIGVLAAGVVLVTTGWPYVDPIVGVAIGLFILPRDYGRAREALRVLLEMAPDDVASRACGVDSPASTGSATCTTCTSGR
jgi:cobalt-zinc-cadmium efflux system protein